MQTAPDEDVHSITVISGLIFADADFGNRRGGGSIHGRKFHDRDADGVRDDGEEWLNEWTIQLVDDRGAIVGTQQTHSVDLDNDGQINPATETGWYWFRDVNPGDYTVRELHQTGWRQSAPTSGARSSPCWGRSSSRKS